MFSYKFIETPKSYRTHAMLIFLHRYGRLMISAIMATIFAILLPFEEGVEVVLFILLCILPTLFVLFCITRTYLASKKLSNKGNEINFIINDEGIKSNDSLMNWGFKGQLLQFRKTNLLLVTADNSFIPLPEDLPEELKQLVLTKLQKGSS